MKIFISIMTCLALLSISSFSFAAENERASSQPIAMPANQAAVVVDNGDDEDEPSAISLAKIIKVEPIYVTRMVPHEYCHMEPRAYMYPNQRALPGSGMIAGGAVGGLIGNRFGGGNGNIAATIGGSVIGALIGNNIEGEMNRPYVVESYVQVCHTQLVKESHIKGYKVTYLLNGKSKTTFMKKKPKSNFIRLELAPVDAK